jgi:hypothetical protein
MNLYLWLFGRLFCITPLVSTNNQQKAHKYTRL